MQMDEREAKAIGIVRQFGAAWDRLDFDGIAALLAPEVCFRNGPLPPLAGRGAVVSYLRAAGPFDSCRWELRAVAACGDLVLTERVDHLVIAGAAIYLPIMGVFEIAAGLIAEWRDYFDLAAYRAQWPPSEVRS